MASIENWANVKLNFEVLLDISVSFYTSIRNNVFPTYFLFFTYFRSVQFSQSLSRVRLFATPWIAAGQASLSIANFRSSLRLASIKSVMPSSHLIFCCPLFLLPPIPPSITVFSNESTLLLSPVTSTAGYCFCFGSIPSFFLELFLHWSPVAYWAPTDLEGINAADTLILDY